MGEVRIEEVLGRMVKRVDELEAERDALRARAERAEEGHRMIRMRYFPVDDGARVEWAKQTFQIAHDVLAAVEPEGTVPNVPDPATPDSPHRPTWGPDHPDYDEMGQ